MWERERRERERRERVMLKSDTSLFGNKDEN
jgi:hypothetical protein